MKQFTLLNSILAVTSLESQDGKGAYLNEAQLQAFEDAISGKDNRITELTQHETNCRKTPKLRSTGTGNWQKNRVFRLPDSLKILRIKTTGLTGIK